MSSSYAMHKLSQGKRIFATIKPRCTSAMLKIHYSYLHFNAIQQ